MRAVPTSRRGPRATAILLTALFLCAFPWAAPPAARGQGPGEPARRPRRVGPAPSSPAPAPASRPTPAAGEEVDEDEVVRVDTQLVSVPAVVTDRTGRPLTNLRADNFVVLEDGSPQKLASFATADAPFEVALLLDTSGSTRAEVGLIKRAAEEFIAALRPGDRVAVVGFSTREEGSTKLAEVEVMTYLTDDREALRDAVGMVGASAGTPFYDSLERVAKDVFREPPREELKGRRALVALTDGVDSTSEADFESARERLKRAGLVCYFVQVNTEEYVEDRIMQSCEAQGRLRLSRTQLERYRGLYGPRAADYDASDFCRMGQFERMDVSRALYRVARREMDSLAKESGGKTFPVSDLRDARNAFRQVAQEIGTLYSLAYYSTNKARDGGFRTIRVQLRGVSGAQVRAREGYKAPSS